VLLRPRTRLSRRSLTFFAAAVAAAGSVVLFAASPTTATPSTDVPETSSTEIAAVGSTEPVPPSTPPLDTTPASTEPTGSESPDTEAPATSDGSVDTVDTGPVVESSVPVETSVETSDVPVDSPALSTELASLVPAVAATMQMFVDEDGDFSPDAPGSAAMLGESTGVTIVATARNDVEGPIDSLSIRAPSLGAVAEFAKLDVTGVHVTLAGSTTAQVTVTFGDGSAFGHDVTSDGAIPFAGSGVASVEATFGSGPGSIAGGAAATLTLHGTINDGVGDDDLGDGADPGVGVCITAAASSSGSTASADACDFVDVEAGAGGGLSLLAAVVATWTVSGSNPSWTGTSTLPATGFPPATFATNSLTPTIPSGASAFLGPSTPFGAAYESTQNQPYLSLRASTGGTPSTTTFTFATPTPVGWGFALGDVDADMVTISAIGPSGPLTAAQLGHQGVFNYCQSTPVPSSCGPGSTDVPVWDPATSTLIGNIGDTSGAAGWFRPTVPITSLTLTFTVQSGIPIYQVWFAAPTSNISGEVVQDTPTGSEPAPPGTTIELQEPDGDPITDSFGGPVVAPVDPDGTFAFTDVASQVYQLEVFPAPGFEVAGPTTQLVDATAGDVVVAPFTVQPAGAGTTTTMPAATTTMPGATTTTPGATTTTLGATTTTPGATTVPGVSTTTIGIGGTLPQTGAVLGASVLAALVLIGAGVTLVLATRRLRHGP
jgi:hypothetical protein